MIFYFSGTGNSKLIAEEIAKLTSDKCINIEDVDTYNIDKEERIGFVFPIYAWGVAGPMVEFIKNLKKTSIYTFAIATCGESAGKSLKNLASIYKLDSSYSITMPNNYIIGSDIEEDDVIRQKITKAINDLPAISREILTKRSTYKVKEGRLSGMKSSVVNMGFNNFARSTKSFSVSEACVSCSICEGNCPSKSIMLHDGKPVWKGSCYMCMRCINNCPTCAIQYGKNTIDRKRYNLKKYL